MKKIICLAAFAAVLAIFLCACCETIPPEPTTEATTLPSVTEATTIATEPSTQPPTEPPTEPPIVTVEAYTVAETAVYLEPSAETEPCQILAAHADILIIA